MNYLFYRRLRGPVFLLTFGVTAALAQWDVLSFSKSWPLYLIVYGVLRLAEGAALAGSTQMPVYPAASYQAQAYSGANYGGVGYQAAPSAVPGTGLATVTPATIQTATTQNASNTEEVS